MRFKALVIVFLTLFLVLPLNNVSALPEPTPFTTSNNMVRIDDKGASLNLTENIYTTGGSFYAELANNDMHLYDSLNIILTFKQNNVEETTAKPKAPYKYNPQTYAIEHTYQCNNLYNITQDPLSFVCYHDVQTPIYENSTGGGNNTTSITGYYTETIIDKEGVIESWNDEGEFFWYTTEIVGWEKINNFYPWSGGGFDGYRIDNIPFTPDTRYDLMFPLDLPFNTSGKIEGILWPSELSLNTAIAMNHYIYFDPWWNISYLTKFKIFDPGLNASDSWRNSTFNFTGCEDGNCTVVAYGANVSAVNSNCSDQNVTFSELSTPESTDEDGYFWYNNSISPPAVVYQNGATTCQKEWINETAIDNNGFSSELDNTSRIYTRIRSDDIGIDALYHIDEGSGTEVNDSTASDFDSNFFDGADWITSAGACAPIGITGYTFENDNCLDFVSANTDEVNFPTGITGYPFAMDTWVIFETFGVGDAALIFTDASSSTVRYGIRDRSSTIGISARNDAQDPATGFGILVDTGVWHHVVINWKNSTSRSIYINGSFIAEYAEVVDFNAGVDTLIMGQLRKVSPVSFLEGSLDETAIYSRLLVPDEIVAHFERKRFHVKAPVMQLGNESVLFINDTTPPNIIIDIPTNSTSNNTTPELNASMNDSNPDFMNYSVDGNLNVTVLGSVINVTISSLSDGNHNIRVCGNDTFNNINCSTVFFTVDVTGPDINITNPTNSTFFSSIVQLFANATDNRTNVSLMFFSVDDASNSTPQSPNISATIGPLSNGTHNVRVCAIDILNNENCLTRFFSVSVVDIEFISPTPNNGSSISAFRKFSIAAEITLENIDDSFSGVRLDVHQLDDSSFFAGWEMDYSNSSSSKIVSVVEIELPTGSFKYRVRVLNSSNVVFISDFRDIFVSSSPITIDLISPTPSMDGIVFRKRGFSVGGSVSQSSNSIVSATLSIVSLAGNNIVGPFTMDIINKTDTNFFLVASIPSAITKSITDLDGFIFVTATDDAGVVRTSVMRHILFKDEDFDISCLLTSAGRDCESPFSFPGGQGYFDYTFSGVEGRYILTIIFLVFFLIGLQKVDAGNIVSAIIVGSIAMMASRNGWLPQWVWIVEVIIISMITMKTIFDIINE